VGEWKWRTAYRGEATSVPLRQLLQSADDDDGGGDEYACRVTSYNNYGWGTPSDVLTFNRVDAGKLLTISGQRLHCFWI